jgi:PGDYG protein
VAGAHKALRTACGVAGKAGSAMPKAHSGTNAAIEFERDDPEILKALRGGKRYRKVGEVRARKVKRNTAVETVLADGTRETSNIAGPGDYIVTGPRGERYALQPETFEARYTLKPGAQNVYLARGEAIAVENPFGRPISIVASWGERQFGTVDCMIADRIDPATNRRAGRPYIIGRAEFEDTYERVPPRKKP